MRDKRKKKKNRKSHRDRLDSTQVSEKKQDANKQTYAESPRNQQDYQQNLSREGYMSFFFESVYQIVTWVLIAGAIGFLLLFFSRQNWIGVLWSACALVCFITIMLSIIAQRTLPVFRAPINQIAQESEAPSPVQQESVSHMTTKNENQSLHDISPLHLRKENEMAKTDNRITNSPIINSPNSVQAPGGTVNIHQAPQDRAFTAEQRAQLVAYLKGRPKTTVTVLSIITDAEAARFANILYAILKEAGWTMKNPFPGMATFSFTGIHIQVESERNAAAGVLQHGLEVLGFKADGQLSAGIGEEIILIIGSKP